jgi:hypothetical protein
MQSLHELWTLFAEAGEQLPMQVYPMIEVYTIHILQRHGQCNAFKLLFGMIEELCISSSLARTFASASPLKLPDNS